MRLVSSLDQNGSHSFVLDEGSWRGHLSCLELVVVLEVMDGVWNECLWDRIGYGPGERRC